MWSLELFLNKRERSSTAPHRCPRHPPHKPLCACGRPAPQCSRGASRPGPAQARDGRAAKRAGRSLAHRARAGWGAWSSDAASWPGGPAAHAGRPPASHAPRQRRAPRERHTRLTQVHTRVGAGWPRAGGPDPAARARGSPALGGRAPGACAEAVWGPREGSRGVASAGARRSARAGASLRPCARPGNAACPASGVPPSCDGLRAHSPRGSSSRGESGWRLAWACDRPRSHGVPRPAPGGSVWEEARPQRRCAVRVGRGPVVPPPGLRLHVPASPPPAEAGGWVAWARSLQPGSSEAHGARDSPGRACLCRASRLCLPTGGLPPELV